MNWNFGEIQLSKLGVATKLIVDCCDFYPIAILILKFVFQVRPSKVVFTVNLTDTSALPKILFLFISCFRQQNDLDFAALAGMSLVN